jgi:hypothetical protein
MTRIARALGVRITDVDEFVEERPRAGEGGADAPPSPV